MRNPLNKRLPREFKKNAGKYLGILFILIITVVLGSSFNVMLDSAMKTLDQNDVECVIEDGQFEAANPILDKTIEEIEELGVEVAKNYYLPVDDFDTDATLIVFNEREEINLPSIFEGELPKKDDEIAIERLFATNRGIKVGDKVSLDNGEYTVTATIAVPDYSALYKNNQDLFPNTSGFGVALVSNDAFEVFDEDKLNYRYSYKFEESGLSRTDRKNIEEDMMEIMVGDGVVLQSFLTAEDNQAISFLREDMGKDGPVMQVFVYILILVIAFVFSILTNNTIESEAAVIGTLRALGYKKSEIIWHYLKPTVIIAMVSAVVGNILGYTVMQKPFENMYYSTYSMAPIQIRFNLLAFLTSTILPIVIMILINWWMLHNKLSLSPLKFLRRDLSKKKQKKAVKLPEFKFFTRFRLRVLIQNKVSYIILFFGVFLASFLLMFGIGLKPLIDNYVEEIDDSLQYEYQYILKAPTEPKNGDGEKLLAYNMETWYDLSKDDISVSFMGISEDSKYFDGVELPDKEGEITVSAPLAEKLGLLVGDEIVFKDTYYDEKHTLVVSKVCDYKGSLTVFMSRENLNKLIDNEVDMFNSYVSDEKLDIDENYLVKCITRDDMVRATKELMSVFDGILQIVNIFSVIVYMILMYILTKTVIEKNTVPISFMKVFGYNNKEIGKLYLNATTMVVLISLVVCIPLEALCFKYILVYIGSMIEGHIPFYLPPWICVAIIIIGILAYLAINMIHVRKIRRIPMSEAMKERE